uniref:ATP-binding protein n=1 Tax=Panagrellus redivivus TaxID=6233 RepID=A0A7E4URK7_PANRE
MSTSNSKHSIYKKIHDKTVQECKLGIAEWNSLQQKYAKVDISTLSKAENAAVIKQLDLLHEKLVDLYIRQQAAFFEWYNYVEMLDPSETTERTIFKAETKPHKGSTNIPYEVMKALENISLIISKAETSPVAFKKFPYEFQQRLVHLLPIPSIIPFKNAGQMAKKAVESRGNFVSCLTVAKKTSPLKKIFGKILLPEIFLSEKRPFHIKKQLVLELDNLEAYDIAVDLITGDFQTMLLDGLYSWRHAVKLIRKGYRLHIFLLRGEMIIDIDEFNDFCNEMKDYAIGIKSFDIHSVHDPNLQHALVQVFDGHETHACKQISNRIFLRPKVRALNDANDDDEVKPDENFSELLKSFHGL